MASLAESLRRREEIFRATCFLSPVAAPLPASLWNCLSFPSLSKRMAYPQCTCWHLGKSLLESWGFFSLCYCIPAIYFLTPSYGLWILGKGSEVLGWVATGENGKVSSLECFFICSTCYSFSRLSFICYLFSIN